MNFDTAGVTNLNEIPTNVVVTINSGDSIQNAIDEAKSKGGGVVLLRNGEYEVNKTVDFEDGVVLMGQDRDSVVIKSTIRGTKSDKANVFEFDNDSYAGIKNLTIDYTIPGFEPVLDTINDPNGRNDLYVRQINIDDDSENNLISGVNVINSGTNPIRVQGNNNTIIDSRVDGSYNKGGGGNGYFAISGDNNLIRNVDVANLRHFAIQRGANDNVVFGSRFESTDINFHNGDSGNNLVENNDINISEWRRSLDAFNTGSARYGHKAPGSDNILYNNRVTYSSSSSRNDSYSLDQVYTFRGFGDAIITDNVAVPNDGSFFL